MEDCFHYGIKKRKVITIFYLTVQMFFLTVESFFVAIAYNKVVIARLHLAILAFFSEF